MSPKAAVPIEARLQEAEFSIREIRAALAARGNSEYQRMLDEAGKEAPGVSAEDL